MIIMASAIPSATNKPLPLCLHPLVLHHTNLFPSFCSEWKININHLFKVTEIYKVAARIRADYKKQSYWTIYSANTNFCSIKKHPGNFLDVWRP